jgi:hypothetical protein
MYKTLSGEQRLFVLDSVPDGPVLCTKINQLGNGGFFRPTYVGLCSSTCTKICQVSNDFSLGLAVKNAPLVGVSAGLLLNVYCQLRTRLQDKNCPVKLSSVKNDPKRFL